MIPGPTGVVILDSNCYKHLEDRSRRELLLRSVEAFGWFIWPSAVNAFELVKHSLPDKREKLLTTVHAVQRGRPLLPVPDEVLRLTGEALLSGSELRIGESGYEWLTEKPFTVTEDQIQDISQTMAAVDAIHADAMDRGRGEIQKLYKAKNIQPWWRVAGEFLSEVWMTPSQLDELIVRDCSRLGFATSLTYQQVMECEAWRLHFESFGVALFRRVMSKDEAKLVQYWDLSQLVYLGGRAKRILVSEDTEFRRAAIAVLDGRHAGARVIGWEEFLDLHSVCT